MSNTASVVFLAFTIVESLIIVFANIFTIYVFWKHRIRLRRNSFLLKNLAVADLLVGLIEAIALGASDIPSNFGKESPIKDTPVETILRLSRLSYFCASVAFLVMISLERTYALIYPLRHRVLSSKWYHWSAFVVWMIVIIIFVTWCLLSEYDILKNSWTSFYASFTLLSFAVICASCYVIRRGLSRRFPVLNTVHDIKNGTEQNSKLSKTLYIMIAASLVCWFPSVVVYSIYFQCGRSCLPKTLFSFSSCFRLANSWINPVIYCLKFRMFKRALTSMNPCKQSQRYRVRQS